jgi:uncharacterized Fe-S cluster-containing radical SAM superfamily protein
MQDPGRLFDPVALAADTRLQVSEGDRRRYYRFRPARFYGGIATADCVGCCLRCLFCWSWNVVTRPAGRGSLHAPADVAARLEAIARKKRFDQIRISGNEPTLLWDHLMAVLGHLGGERTFILETNGILLGEDDARARDLARFPNVEVRVSLKGSSAEEFSRLTGAEPRGFDLQIAALENLSRRGVRACPACMISFSSEESIADLRRRLRDVHRDFEDFEEEELILYPSVEKRLEDAGLAFRAAHRPNRIPPGQV